MKTIQHRQDIAIQETAFDTEKQQARGLLRAFIALRHRNFRLFWFGQLVSLIGTWMQSIGQSWLVLELTHNALLLGVVGALQFLPVLLFTLFGGVRGLIIAALGVAPLFLLNGLSFISVLIGLVMIDMTKLHALDRRLAMQKLDQKQGTIKSLREGLVYVFQTPSVLLIIAVIGAISLFGINFNVVLPLFATEVLHAGPTGFGFISSSFGIGSLLSALWLAWNNKKPSVQQMLVGGTVFCAAEAAFAISHLYVLSLVLIAAVGFAQIAFTAIANTTLQTVAPNHLRGRVMSVYMMVFNGSTPIGNIFTGGLAAPFGASISLLAGALLSLVAVVFGWIYRKPAERSLAEATVFKIGE